jgi:hypothetical protein
VSQLDPERSLVQSFDSDLIHRRFSLGRQLGILDRKKKLLERSVEGGREKTFPTALEILRSDWPSIGPIRLFQSKFMNQSIVGNRVGFGKSELYLAGREKPSQPFVEHEQKRRRDQIAVLPRVESRWLHAETGTHKGTILYSDL